MQVAPTANLERSIENGGEGSEPVPINKPVPHIENRGEGSEPVPTANSLPYIEDDPYMEDEGEGSETSSSSESERFWQGQQGEMHDNERLSWNREVLAEPSDLSIEDLFPVYIHVTCWQIVANRSLAPLFFKIGITHDPKARWGQYYYEGYSQMFLLLETNDPEEAENLERFLIRWLRVRCDRCTDPQKPRIQNEIPGGEGAMRRFPPPYYTYMTIGSGVLSGKLRRERNLALTRKRKRDSSLQ